MESLVWSLCCGIFVVDVVVELLFVNRCVGAFVFGVFVVESLF